MERKKFVLLLLVAALVCGVVSLVTPWFSIVVDGTNRADPAYRVTIQNDFYGYQVTETTTTRTPGDTDISTKIYSYANIAQRGNAGRAAGVFENAFAMSVGILALLGIVLLSELFGAKVRIPAETSKLILYLVGFLSLFNLINLPYAIAASTGESLFGSRIDVSPAAEIRYSAFPSFAIYALVVQFLMIGLIIYSLRYGMPSLPRRKVGVAPAYAPAAPGAPGGAPMGYTPTTFIPPPPQDNAPAPNPYGNPNAQNSGPYAPLSPPPVRRPPFDQGQDTIPPAPPGS